MAPRRGFCRHLCSLLWKNWLIKRRTPLTTIAEVALPVFIMAVIIAIRSAISRTDYTLDLHTEDSVAYNAYTAGNISLYLAAYPKYRNAAHPNRAKLVFAAYDQSTLTPIVGNFTALYPDLARSILTSNPDDAQAYMKGADYGIGANPYYAAVISVEQVASAVNGWQAAYTIRLNSSQTVGDSAIAGLPDMSQSAYDALHWTYDSSWTQLVSNGEVFFQTFMDGYTLLSAMAPGSPFPSRNLLFTPMPTPAYIDDQFADTVGGFLGLLFTVVFLWPVTRIIKLMVEEKETRIKEGMRMMGLQDATLWLSWLLTYALIFIITSLLITLITANNVFEYSDKGYVFFFFLLVQLSFFSFCLLCSSVFSQSRVASTFGALVFLAIYFPYYAVFQDDVSKAQKTLACLSPPLCMGLGVVNIIQFEGAQTGVNRNNVSTQLNNFDYASTMGMLLLDFLGLILLALYVERVFPQQYGLPLPWYFPFQPSFWFPSLRKPPALASQLAINPAHTVMEPVRFADDSNRPELGVSIKQLRKEFVIDRGSPPMVAVSNLSLDLYTGQILCLLGHNGAGKSTTLSMLSGLLPPTSGDAHVFGQSILNAMPAIRATLGVCPQHNILFPLLTVREHLELYAAIKGVERSRVAEVVAEMIKQVGLEEKVGVRSHALSGGMQRKLSVAIALIGDSRIVFLDEPTSGMDPYSRRATWDLLKKMKAGRVIILTTHFMDEADQLGDRIAIMAQGSIQCVGSPLFLKTHYGVGYSLTLVKDANCDEDAVQATIAQHVPKAELVNNIAGEMAYQLPTQSSPHFADLFDTFDAHMQQWAIQSYGISVTTLEQVFLKVGKDADSASKMHGRSRDDMHAEAKRDKERDREMELTPRRVDVAEKKAWVNPPMSPSVASVAESANGSHGYEEKEPLGGSSGPMVMSSPSAVKGMDFAALTSPSQPTAHPPSQSQPAGEVFDAFGVIEYDHSYKTLRHVRALLIKRLQNARRNKKSWCWTIIIPFLVMIIFLATTKALNDIHVPDDRVDLSQYNLPNVVAFSSNTPQVLATVAGGSEQLVLVNESGVVASNATAFASYLYSSAFSMQLSRFGALMYSANASQAGLQEQAELFFNTTAPYSLPAFYNLYNTALLRTITGNPNANIQLNFWGFPETTNIATLFSSLTAIIIAIAFAFIPANFIHYSVKERSVQFKHQQMISGVGPVAYWAANFLFDFLNFLVPAALCLLALGIYDISQLIGSNTGATVVALLLYALSVIPFSAFCSYLFTSPTSAQNVMLIFYIIIGAFLLIASLVLDIIASTHGINQRLKYIYRLLPTFAFSEAIANIIDRQSPTYFGTPQALFSYNVVGADFIFMAWESLFYTALVLLIEHIQASPALFTFFTRRMSSPIAAQLDEDADVKAERTRLQAVLATPGAVFPPISALGLRKVYGGRGGVGVKVAVHDLWLGVESGECLGFLGINGAGKTSSMKMLTAELYPSSGDARLAQMHLLTQQQAIKEKIGYCPQFDALQGTLTAREHLTLFARIKGVKEAQLRPYVQAMIDRLGLQEGIEDRPCKGYSGGNKRKLSVGLALIGNPPIVFLDEPSTGMDPASRRLMWSFISKTMKGRSVMLTTHSMEEAEALTQRIAIMVGGSLRCIGTSQRLKALYGQGYQLDVTIAPDRRDAFQQEVLQRFGHCRLVEAHDSYLKYDIPKQGQLEARVSIGQVFRCMEALKERYGVHEYAVQETSLEQIFIHFAKQQQEEKGTVAGLTDIVNVG